MDRDDEPVLKRESDTPRRNVEDIEPLVKRITKLVTQQLYAVLCTHGEDQAYGSLVAFAFTSDLRTAVFATPIATRKYRLLCENQRVALVIDDRPQHPGAMMQVEAITATGHAQGVQSAPLLDEYSRLLVGRHPQLADFVAADSCALFQITITRFLHVSRFQDVQQWVPVHPS